MQDHTCVAQMVALAMCVRDGVPGTAARWHSVPAVPGPTARTTHRIDRDVVTTMATRKHLDCMRSDMPLFAWGRCALLCGFAPSKQGAPSSFTCRVERGEMGWSSLQPKQLRNLAFKGHSFFQIVSTH